MTVRVSRHRRYEVAGGEDYVPAMRIEYIEGDTSVDVRHVRDLQGTAEVDELIETLKEVRRHMEAAERGAYPPS